MKIVKLDCFIIINMYFSSSHVMKINSPISFENQHPSPTRFQSLNALTNSKKDQILIDASGAVKWVFLTVTKGIWPLTNFVLKVYNTT